MPIIAIENLTRRYGSRMGVESVTLAVPEGSLFGFLGPNGAGKTTLIRVLLAFLRPTSGTARIFGLDCWSAGRRIKAEIGYVPGDLRLYPWVTGRSALRIVGAVRGRDLARPGRDLAERFDLDLRVRVRNMSRGMRQKLGLILALAHNPRLLILDEPTAALDPLMQDALHAHLRSLAGAGHTVFFSSHSLAEVDALCDRVAIVRSGRLVAEESLGALRSHAGHHCVVRWRSGAGDALTPPSFLRVERRAADEWTASLDGPVARLIDWLAGKPLDDLSISPPDLDALFRRHYDGAGPAE